MARIDPLPYLEDVQSVLLGGLITLAVTAVVQIFVIPWVQRRTRGLERWEKDVIELVTVVNEEWPERDVALRNALRLRRAMRVRAAEMRADGDKTADHLARQANAGAQPAYTEAHDLTTRMAMLLRRCTLVNTQAPYWSNVFNRLFTLIRELRELNPERSDVLMSGADLDKHFQQMSEAHDRLSEALLKISMPVKPPPIYPARRALRRVKQAGYAIVGRRKAKSLPPAP